MLTNVITLAFQLRSQMPLTRMVDITDPDQPFSQEKVGKMIGDLPSEKLLTLQKEARTI
jgi:hypothetical protein